MKSGRHEKIIELVNNYDINTQEELLARLNDAGFSATQATISRDIKELGLIKTASKDGGYKYSSPNSGATAETKHIAAFSDAVISVNCALHTVVIRTFAGMAQAVCASVDMLIGSRIMGSVAGDDTILIIMQSEQAAVGMCDELKRIFKN